MTTRRALRTRAVATQATAAGRTITVRLMTWDTPATVSDDGRRTYREQYRRGSILAGSSRMLAVLRHRGAIAGRLTNLRDRDDGLYGDVVLSGTSAADDVLALVDGDDPIIDGVSIEVDTPDDPAMFTGGLVTYTPQNPAILTGVAFDPYPMHTESRVLAVRAHERPTMDEDEVTTPPDEGDDTNDARYAAATVRARVKPDENPAPTEPAARRDRARPATTDRRPVARPGGAGVAGTRFRSFGEFCRAAWNGDVEPAVLEQYGEAMHPRRRALTDLTTTDVPSIVRESWVTEIIDLVSTRTPTVNAFSQRPLPATGMSISQPKVTARPTVGEQATQKTAITSTELDFAPVQWPVKTYAGGNDVAMQLIERADISFLDEMMRLYAQAMAVQLNTAAATDLLAAANDVHAQIELVGTDFNSAVIDGAALILGALGVLPKVCVLSIDLWKVLGKKVDSDGRPVYPGISPVNPQGSFSVTSPSGEVRGLDYVVEGAFGAGNRAVLGVPDAFVTRRSGLKTITADRPELIGRDIAVYEYAAIGAVDAAGLALIVDLV